MNPLRRRIKKSCQELLYLSNDLQENVNKKDLASILSRMRYSQEIIKRGVDDVETSANRARLAVMRHAVNEAT